MQAKAVLVAKNWKMSTWIHCHQVSNRDLVTFLKISLDAGETEAIAG
jgi:predicted nucleic acid-binding protein